MCKEVAHAGRLPCDANPVQTTTVGARRSSTEEHHARSTSSFRGFPGDARSGLPGAAGLALVAVSGDGPHSSESLKPWALAGALKRRAHAIALTFATSDHPSAFPAWIIRFFLVNPNSIYRQLSRYSGHCGSGGEYPIDREKIIREVFAFAAAPVSAHVLTDALGDRHIAG